MPKIVDGFKVHFGEWKRADVLKRELLLPFSLVKQIGLRQGDLLKLHCFENDTTYVYMAKKITEDGIKMEWPD